MGTGLQRSIVLAIVGTAIAALASLTPPMRHLELWAGDLQMRMTAAPQPGDQAIVVAIDDASLESLRPIAGQWPFDRTVFARVTDFLSSAGARAVVYDVLFADERPGDPAMAEALARSAVPVTLAAVATPFALDHAGNLGRVKGQGWRISRDDLPAREWRDVRLPRTEFGKARIGIANVVPDEDGVLRRMPMLHRIDGAVVPSLSFSALFPGDAPAVSVSSGMLTVGSRRWPVDGDGQVALIVPAQPHPVPQVSFATVARAAIDRTEVAEVSRLVKGRTVFIGATALLLGDAAMTPRGRTAGVLILAQAFVGIDRGLVLESHSWLLAGVLLCSALVWPIAARLVRPSSMTSLSVATAAGVVVAEAVGAALVAWWRQPTPIVLTALATLTTFMLFLADKIMALRSSRQRLTAERLAAERASALKGQFLAHVSHELRSPLTAIIGFSGMLTDDTTLNANTRSIVQIVKRSGEQLLLLVNNLLDQAQIDAGHMAIVPAETSVPETLSQALATLAGVPRRPGVELETGSSGRVPPRLWIDGQRLRQIVINLCANALKFTERGRVDVMMDWNDGWLEVAVRDTGSGIPAESLERIFDAFQQAGDPTARKGGTGLGLSISRNLARLMGGDITVESATGVGFHLPRPSPRPARGRARRAADATRGNGLCRSEGARGRRHGGDPLLPARLPGAPRSRSDPGGGRRGRAAPRARTASGNRADRRPHATDDRARGRSRNARRWLLGVHHGADRGFRRCAGIGAAGHGVRRRRLQARRRARADGSGRGAARTRSADCHGLRAQGSWFRHDVNRKSVQPGFAAAFATTISPFPFVTLLSPGLEP